MQQSLHFLSFIVLESVSKSKRKPFKTEENQNTQQQNQTDAPKTKKILDSVSKLDSGAVTTLIDDCRRLFLTQHEHSESNGKTHKLDALDIFKTRDDVLKLLDCEGALFLFVAPCIYCFLYL